MIVTFYSYKGGVGRSMALANVAQLFYEAGLKVLMVDWDLEAPGLERFFFPQKQVDKILSKPGLMDLLEDYKQQMAQEWSVSDSEEKSLLFAPLDEYIQSIHTGSSGPGKLWLLTAGRRSKKHFTEYAKKVLTFDWRDFYQNWEGERYIEWLRQRLEKRADVVLVDSRTGVTEIGGICTYHLADVVVLFCAPHQQSLEGTYEMVINFTAPQVRESRPERPLTVVVVPARLEQAEGSFLNQFKRDFLTRFQSKFAPPAFKEHKEILWDIGIPYVPYYAYNEVVAVQERESAIAKPMVEAFERLARVLARLAPNSSSIRQVFDSSESYDVFLRRDRPTAASTGALSQYRKLLDWLDRLSDEEIQEIMASLLAAVERSRLRAPVEEVNRSAFLDILQDLGRLDDLEAYLQDHTGSRFEKELALSEAVSKRIPFTSREGEIAQIFASYAPSYYLLVAPPGYGKTTMLRELERRFEEQGWRCAYVSIEEHREFVDLLDRLAEALDITPVQDNELPWALRLSGALRQQWISAPKEGLVLLIDFERDPSPITIGKLLEELIPAVQDSLSTLEFFADQHNRFRVILAGNYLAGLEGIRSTRLPFRVIYLAPFDYSVIRDTARQYLARYDERSIDQFAAHLVHLTGGHPGCTAQILGMYSEKGMPPDSFVRYYGQTIWREIMRPVVDNIRARVVDSGLEQVLDRLSVLRYLDYAVLRRLIEHDPIPDIVEAHRLADILTTSHLASWEGRFLRSEITRRLFVIRLRQEMPDAFVEYCRQAQEICADRVREPMVQRPEIWVIEYLFQSLQRQAVVIQDVAQRRETRETFFSKDLPNALQMFSIDRNIPLESTQMEQMAIYQVLEEDWEFRFTVNYYLREKEYSDEPFNKLQHEIGDFFSSPSYY